MPACFWLVVALKILCGGHLRPWGVILLLFVVAHFEGPNNRITSHPTLITKLAIAPNSNSSLPPIFGWLLCISIKWQLCCGHGVFFFIFFISQFATPNKGKMSPPHVLPWLHLFLNTPQSRWHLLFEYFIYMVIGSHVDLGPTPLSISWWVAFWRPKQPPLWNETNWACQALTMMWQAGGSHRNGWQTATGSGRGRRGCSPR